tara:strand:+ start:414 stop:665 length:252 start_codon:yes stop_codon:yes gene_type:complete
VTEKQFQEYSTLSKAWKVLLDKKNKYLNESNAHRSADNFDESMNSFYKYVGYSEACNELFELMMNADKPKQLELDVMGVCPNE